MTADASASAIWTVGHSNRSFPDFVALLQSCDIEHVADVRKMPRSRRNPQFSIDTLPEALASLRIAYTHFPALGGLRRPRPDSPNGGWRNRSFQGYADYMQTTEFAEALASLIQLASGRRVAIMCAEAVPWRCHRSLIADACVARGIPVQHILSATRIDCHSLRPWARIRAGRVVYPPSAETAGGAEESADSRT